ncbi:hypothetical protein BU15DRAFT_59130 [Melanogaster broomeanus]|nr:hypothetical protein BU15DRAFT_59130 [Melanogaster broomeanus]
MSMKSQDRVMLFTLALIPTLRLRTVVSASTEYVDDNRGTELHLIAPAESALHTSWWEVPEGPKESRPHDTVNMYHVDTQVLTAQPPNVATITDMVPNAVRPVQISAPEQSELTASQFNCIQQQGHPQSHRI